MKNIKRVAAALCAGIAFNCAAATEMTVPLLSKLKETFDAVSAASAPTRSLYNPATEKIAKDVFSQNDVIVFGEIHHSTNYKYLADNPAFFREAAANGVRSIFIELPVIWMPLLESYASGSIGEDDFAKEMLANFESIRMTSGTSAEDYAQQFVSLCRTAKTYGVTVRPSDFRTMSDAIGTSDAYGIPDILERKDFVYAHTLETMRLYKEQTGLAGPITNKQRIAFNHLYLDTLAERPVAEQKRYYEDLQSRKQVWNRYDTDEKLAGFQNALQARYVSQVTRPSEKLGFIGGSRHFFQSGSIGDYAMKYGHERVVGIELISANGLLWRSGLEPKEVTELRQNGHQFKYQIQTDAGQATQLVPAAVTKLSVR